MRGFVGHTGCGPMQSFVVGPLQDASALCCPQDVLPGDHLVVHKTISFICQSVGRNLYLTHKNRKAASVHTSTNGKFIIRFLLESLHAFRDITRGLGPRDFADCVFGILQSTPSAKTLKASHSNRWLGPFCQARVLSQFACCA